jgi:hypothetical protein
LDNFLTIGLTKPGQSRRSAFTDHRNLHNFLFETASPDKLFAEGGAGAQRHCRGLVAQ